MSNQQTTKPAAPARPKRKPVGTRQRIEVTNRDPNREYRLIDADPARLADFEAAGYRVDNIRDHIPGGQRTDVATPIDNSIPVGGGKKQVLVSIEREFYEEDQAAKQQKVLEREAALNPATQSGERYGSVKVGRGDIKFQD